MEFLALVLMVAFGAGVAAAVVGVARRFERREAAAAARQRTDRATIERDVLAWMLGLAEKASGGRQTLEPIDLTSWGEAFAAQASIAQRLELLDRAVEVSRTFKAAISLEQYRALIELCFALGFHADAFAKTRASHHVEIDAAAFSGRPSRSNPPLFDNGLDLSRHLATLGLAREELSRREVATAYRKLAAQLHPDRFHDASDDERQRAAARFMELHRSYEYLIRAAAVEK